MYNQIMAEWQMDSTVAEQKQDSDISVLYISYCYMVIFTSYWIKTSQIPSGDLT